MSSTVVAVALAVLAVALAGLAAYVVNALRRLDTDVQRLLDRYPPRRPRPVLPPPPRQVALPPMRPRISDH